MKVYGAAREEAATAAVESDAVAQAVSDLMKEEENWKGTATELLVVLEKQVGDRVAASRGWPRGPRALSGRLRRSAPALRHVGVEAEAPVGSSREGRQWQLSRIQTAPANDRHDRHDRHPSKENAGDCGDGCTPDGDGSGDGCTSDGDGGDGGDGRLQTQSAALVEGEI